MTQETPEHRSWRGMIERCRNPNHKGFRYYGARGVTVCERWHTFAAFLADMGPKPTPRHTIDRKDTNGNYEPDNCRWATFAEQRANQRLYDESARVRKAWESRSRVAKGRLDLTGQRYGRLVVLGYSDTLGGRLARWHVRCDCGTETVALAKTLRNGGTTSCGCRNREAAAERARERNATDNPAKYRWGRA